MISYSPIGHHTIFRGMLCFGCFGWSLVTALHGCPTIQKSLCLFFLTGITMNYCKEYISKKEDGLTAFMNLLEITGGSIS